MILTDWSIKYAMEAGDIVVSPFDEKRLGSNSYDVRLGKNLLVYEDTWRQIDEHKTFGVLDAADVNPTRALEIPPEGLILSPGILYLGVTEEYTESRRHVPFLDGKSSIGRLGIFIHATAGRGDVGFCGHWTMEISVVQKVRVYPGMPIGQLYWFEATPVVNQRYSSKPSAKYAGGPEADPAPKPSRMHLNFEKGGGS